MSASAFVLFSLLYQKHTEPWILCTITILLLNVLHAEFHFILLELTKGILGNEGNH